MKGNSHVKRFPHSHFSLIFPFFVPTPTAMTFATARQKVRRSQGKKLKEKEGKNVFPHVPSVVLGQLIPLFDPV